ncbi:MAG: PQQ-dependent sugar dehydrogenase [Thermoanaerobaculia bacterium]
MPNSKSIALCAAISAAAALAAAPATRAAISFSTTVTLPAGACPDKIGHPPLSHDLFILDKRGFVWRRDPANPGTVLSTAFLDIDASVQANGCDDETGLLGFAFDANYASNHFLYVYYTRNDGDEEVERINTSLLNPDGTPTAPARQVVMIMCDPAGNHNGGNLEVGPFDGYLYIGTGDGGGGCDNSGSNSGTCISAPSGAHAQNISPDSVLGKLLRVDPNGADAFPADANRNYAIPATNPFVGDGTKAPEIWLYGLRNPWRWSFDRLTGDLWIGDVGQDNREEIDYLAATSGLTPGNQNWGWVCCEANLGSNVADPTNGNHKSCTSGGSVAPAGWGPEDCSLANCTTAQNNYVPPVQVRTHGGDGACAIVGGYRYRGLAVRDLLPTDGPSYVYTDYCNDTVWVSNGSGATWSSGNLGSFGFTVNSFGEDGRGELWVTDKSASQIRLISDPNTVFADGFEVGDTLDWSASGP